MTEWREQVTEKTTSDLWDARPDWLMLAISAALVVGWVLWIAVTAYRLLVT